MNEQEMDATEETVEYLERCTGDGKNPKIAAALLVYRAQQEASRAMDSYRNTSNIPEPEEAQWYTSEQIRAERQRGIHVVEAGVKEAMAAGDFPSALMFVLGVQQKAQALRDDIVIAMGQRVKNVLSEASALIQEEE